MPYDIQHCCKHFICAETLVLKTCIHQIYSGNITKKHKAEKHK